MASCSSFIKITLKETYSPTENYGAFSPQLHLLMEHILYRPTPLNLVIIIIIIIIKHFVRAQKKIIIIIIIIMTFVTR